MNTIIIAHLYPREMNIYGDLGNIIALTRRLEWRGYAVEVRSVEVGKFFDFSKVDIIFGGGGQDSGQLIVGTDLLIYGEVLRNLADSGMPMLLICGLYQLFGNKFVTNNNQIIKGIDVFNITTIASDTRMIGNIVIESSFGRLVGFENHSGQTQLGVNQLPLGKVKHGFGNNSTRKHEGAVRNNAIGCYLHGPVLPKNPKLADALILAALKRKYGIAELLKLDDSIELRAADVASTRS
jgi:CobQ-like glutamine amidotransferase family enzyme